MYLMVITQKTDTRVMKIENPLIPINVKSAMESSHSVLWKGISYVNIGEQEVKNINYRCSTLWFSIVFYRITSYLLYSLNQVQ